jgi:hypothetical protein
VSLPAIPDIAPEAWPESPKDLRVSIAGLNEFGLPIDPRGISTRLPTDPADREAFALAVGEMVRKTVLLILGFHPSELQEPRA